ncbi:MAG: glycoside hydrolase family 9 protein [Oscillospiraceae bacterium]|nr:glycoside hydrolase family 9 protein [Oscillospiraceae bacterium]
MKNSILRKVSAVCTGAVLTMSSLMGTGMSQLAVNAADTDNYAKLLQYSLYFYDANMCGKQAESASAVTWRGNCHTNDQVDGGFHDAGDHVMFGLPQGYAASTIGWAYYEFKDAFTDLGLTTHYKTISDYFATFFKNATRMNGSSVASICIQKGDGNMDHAYWGAPEKQGDRGGCDWRSNGAGEIAAEYAASLASNYVNFGNAEDLTYAKALYEYAKKNNSPAPVPPFYESDSSNDDLAWAAAWMYLATKDEGYKNDCKQYLGSYQWGVGWVHSWNNVEQGAFTLGAEIGACDWNSATGYLGKEANGSGYKCLTEWGSARYNCALQMAALVADKHGKGNYASWAQGQMTYLLGQNPKNVCFVTGFASNSSKNTHHRAASGYQGYDGDAGFHEGVKTYHPQYGHVLIGALAGGPADAGGTYSDVIDDYKSNEVAIDYNAGLVGAAAGLYAKYKTGSVVTSIEGISPVVLDSASPNPGTTTTPAQTTVSQTQQTTAAPSQGGKQEATVNGSDGMWNIGVKGAKKLTLTIKTNSNDWESNGQYTINGTDKDWKADSSSGQFEVEIPVPSGAENVTFRVWWPNTATIVSAILEMDGTASQTTTSKTTVTTTTAKTTTTTTTSKQTQPSQTTTTTTTTVKQDSGNVKWGDTNCDGKVDVADAVLLARFTSEDTTANVSTQGTKNADVTHDGALKTDDIIKLLRYIAMFISESDLAR